MKIPKTSGLVLWLIPAPDDFNILSALIADLSERYNTPLFSPHITLGRAPKLNQTKLIDSIKELSRTLQPQIITCHNPVCSDSFYQKVRLPLDDNTMRRSFKSATDNHFGEEYAKQDGYHASLMYGSISCSEINLTEIRSRTKEITSLYIQSLAVVDINFTPVQWKVIFETKL
ncbi:hypothetical protein [Rhodohalobacter halophilus]|uniref:hypothetical protein n=1 Tax=Rhodohalobacter halophilus TaxID=1812810 RepID=UPI00083F875D